MLKKAMTNLKNAGAKRSVLSLIEVLVLCIGAVGLMFLGIDRTIGGTARA